jgi:hypothetical protein
MYLSQEPGRELADGEIRGLTADELMRQLRMADCSQASCVDARDKAQAEAELWMARKQRFADELRARMLGAGVRLVHDYSRVYQVRELPVGPPVLEIHEIGTAEKLGPRVEPFTPAEAV